MIYCNRRSQPGSRQPLTQGPAVGSQTARIGLVFVVMRKFPDVNTFHEMKPLEFGLDTFVSTDA